MEVPGRRVNDDRAIHLARGEPMTSLDRRCFEHFETPDGAIEHCRYPSGHWGDHGVAMPDHWLDWDAQQRLAAVGETR